MGALPAGADRRNRRLGRGDDWSYYERWLAALEHVLLDDGVLDKAEIEARMAEIEDHDHHDHDH